MVWGLDFAPRNAYAAAISKRAFEKGLVIELAGAEDNVVKFLPALITEDDILKEGIDIIDAVIGEVHEEMKAEDKAGAK